MTTPSAAEVRHISVALINTSSELELITESILPAVEESTVIRLKEIAEHLTE